MSKPWNPQGELSRIGKARVRSPWPEGATVGLVALAAGCIGIAFLLYQLAGPRQIIAP